MRSRSPRYIPRRPVRHSVRISCQVVRERDFRLVANEIVELSESGLLVRPLSQILTGEPVLLSFMAPFTRTFIDAEGIVARIEHGRRFFDHGPRVGIAIDTMDEAARALVRHQLRFAPEALPRHRAAS